jgi:hypothetical protein
VRFVQLAPGYWLYVDVAFVSARLRQVAGHLQPQSRFRAAAECLVGDIVPLKSKNDPPVGANSDAPITRELAFQRVQPKAR